MNGTTHFYLFGKSRSNQTALLLKLNLTWPRTNASHRLPLIKRLMKMEYWTANKSHIQAFSSQTWPKSEHLCEIAHTSPPHQKKRFIPANNEALISIPQTPTRLLLSSFIKRDNSILCHPCPLIPKKHFGNQIKTFISLKLKIYLSARELFGYEEVGWRRTF